MGVHGSWVSLPSLDFTGVLLDFILVFNLSFVKRERWLCLVGTPAGRGKQHPSIERFPSPFRYPLYPSPRPEIVEKEKEIVNGPGAGQRH